jgi:hypothetical protein
MRRPRRWATAAVLLVTLLASSGCGRSVNAESLLLDASDVPLEYTVADRDDGFFFNGCLLQNVAERAPKGQVVGRRFEAARTGLLFSQSVLSTSDAKAVFAQMRNQLESCEPEVDGMVSASFAVRMERTIALVDGPLVGEESMWISTRTQTSSSSGVGNDAGTPSATVIYRAGNMLVRLDPPPELSFGDGQTFILDKTSRPGR